MNDESLEQPSPLRNVPSRTVGDTGMTDDLDAAARAILDSLSVHWANHGPFDKVGELEIITAALRAQRRETFEEAAETADSLAQIAARDWCLMQVYKLRQQAQEGHD